MPFASKIRARYVKIVPTDWHNGLSIRVAVTMGFLGTPTPPLRENAA